MTTTDDLTVPAPAPAPAPGGIDEADRGYRALREGAAVVDLDGVGLLHVGGPGAHDHVQSVVARDIEFLSPEQSMSTLVLDAGGRPVDVVVCTPTGDGVEIRTGFGAGDAVAALLRADAPGGVEVRDLGAESRLVGIEGPYAWSIVGKMIDPSLPSLPFESVVSLTWRGADIVFSRTGYTGEYGYQVRGPVDVLTTLLDELSAQADVATVADVERAMVEVRQPVLRHELLPDDTVVSAGLNWLVDLSKPAYLGRDALVASIGEPPARVAVGVLGDILPQRGDELVVGDEVVGTIVHGVRSPMAGACIGLARIDRSLAASGLELGLRSPSGETTPVRTASSPYVIPASWHVAIV